MNHWVRRLGVGVIFLSGLSALTVLILPAVLVLLIMLFDTMAHSLLVLLGLFLTSLMQFLPGSDAGGLGPYQTVMHNPLQAAFWSLLRALPCLAGLMLIPWRRQPKRWWAVVLLWSFTACIAGQAVAIMLLPGIAIAALVALPIGAA